MTSGPAVDTRSGLLNSDTWEAHMPISPLARNSLETVTRRPLLSQVQAGKSQRPTPALRPPSAAPPALLASADSDSVLLGAVLAGAPNLLTCPCHPHNV